MSKIFALSSFSSIKGGSFHVKFPGSGPAKMLFSPVSKSPEISDPKISRDFNFHLIPDSKNNYRSAQLPLGELVRICQKYGIKNVIRLNGDAQDGSHVYGKFPSVQREQEKRTLEGMGIKFYPLSPISSQSEVNAILRTGNTLIHCAHGADRTGGNIGNYLYQTKTNPGLVNTEQIWKYTTQYNDWNNMCLNDPEKFVKEGFLRQAQKFGVKDLGQAQDLAKKYKK